ncbi:hypothetical protein [Kozakia baliensis]|uniref:hypothetical protein n=1 Tax=Kozakia baliensis TaxID=153496 RepID=UPI0013149E73|nr:hypothetical protein [Kozakia baliensis]
MPTRSYLLKKDRQSSPSKLVLLFHQQIVPFLINFCGRIEGGFEEIRVKRRSRPSIAPI